MLPTETRNNEHPYPGPNGHSAPPRKLFTLAPATPDLPSRKAPYNLEAEQELLGAILVNNESLDRVSGFLAPADFYDPLHARIFETLVALIYAGRTATPVTVKSFFENTEPIDAHTSVPQYLGRLAANATPSQCCRARPNAPPYRA